MAVINPLVLRLVLPLRKISKYKQISLSDEQLIARGTKRDCYIHPDNPSLCIKVPNDLSNLKACGVSVIEKYCSDTLNKRNVPKTYRTISYEWLQTTKGIGLTVDRVLNADGSPALSLKDYIQSYQPNDKKLGQMFEELKAWIFTYKVPASDLSDSNIFVKEAEEQTHFVMVDGLGGNNLPKMFFYKICPWFARWRTNYRWPREEKNFWDDVYSARQSIM